MKAVAVRTATAADEEAVRVVDRATWTTLSSPAPPPPPDRPFFDDATRPEDVLVAELSGTLVGYVTLGHPFAGEASGHVIHLRGLGVVEAARGRGVGEALVRGAEAEARRRGARRLTLRVLGHNAPARRLYDRLGFVVEGILRGEFVLDGREVDDVLMAKRL